MKKSGPNSHQVRLHRTSLVRPPQPAGAPPEAQSLLPPQGCGHQSAGHRGVAGGDEARLPGLPLGAPAAWPSLGAGVAGGATAAGSEPNGMCARRSIEGAMPQNSLSTKSGAR